MTKEVAKKEENLPAYIKQDQARGSENVTNEDLQLPRLSIIQALSPQLKSKKPEYIEGAEAGMIFNTLTKELYQDQVFFVPVTFEKKYLAWVDQDSGGGLLGVFDTQIEAEQRAAMSDKPAEAVETPTNIGLLVDREGPDGTVLGEITIPMTKSKMKVSRALNSLIRLNGGDRFSRVYVLNVVEETNANNQDYFNFSVANAGFPSEAAYLQAEAMYEAIQAGTKKVTADYSDDLASGPADGEEF